jgi:hypothetical protein
MKNLQIQQFEISFTKHIAHRMAQSIFNVPQVALTLATFLSFTLTYNRAGNVEMTRKIKLENYRIIQ